MGNSVSRVVGCFLPVAHDRERVAVFSEPLDEGLGHSFCYIRPPLDSPHLVSPSLSDRFNNLPLPDSSTSADSLQIFTDKLQILPETSFKSISGASVSANTSTSRSVVCHEQFHSFTNVPDDRAAAFESTASFSSLPLQPVPRGITLSGPVSGTFSGRMSERGFKSGPIERGLMSGPLDPSFMSGPLERGAICMSGPIEDISSDRTHFSAPLVGLYPMYTRRRKTVLGRFIRAVGKPVKRVFAKSLSKTSSTLARTRRSLVAPVKEFVWGQFRDGEREATVLYESPGDLSYSSSEIDSMESNDVQWAQGKAGEDRMHVVLSEKHGWLFVGIYDGFNGPDAPDFLMRNLYRAIYRELQGVLWDQKADSDEAEKLDATDKFDNQATSNRTETDEADMHAKGLACRRHPEGSSLSVTKTDELPSPEHKVPRSGLKEKSEFADDQVSGMPQRLIDRSNNGDARPSNYTSTNVELACGQTPHVRIVESQVDADAACDIAVNRTDSHAESNSATEGSSHDSRPERSWRGRSFLMPKFRQKYSRNKECHRKLLPSRKGWEHHRTKLSRSQVEESKHGSFDQRLLGVVGHSFVLKALARALEATEKAYLEMADRALEENPELALVGSCILVMLMKGEDVYVMNVGDSRAIVAQQRRYEHRRVSSMEHTQYLDNDYVDSAERIAARSSLLQLDLEHIIEEVPTEAETFEAPYSIFNTGIPTSRLSLMALQLSTDHSTSIEEEIYRIKAEHPDDSLSILNDRVKGRLKVTRAFGAGFLKKPRWNNAILEMFRIDYVGSAPYVTCIPALHHHRLTSKDRFLILSSDGLYQYLSNQEVVSHVEWFMENFPEGDPAQHLIEELLFRAAKKAGLDFHELIDIPQGDRRKYHDDVSVMVISLEGRMWRSSIC